MRAPRSKSRDRTRNEPYSFKGAKPAWRGRDRVSAQADKPFEHEARIKELLLRQAELDAALDLDKNETQVVPRGEQGGGRLKSARCSSSAKSILSCNPAEFHSQRAFRRSPCGENSGSAEGCLLRFRAGPAWIEKQLLYSPIEQFADIKFIFRRARDFVNPSELFKLPS